MTQDKRPKFMNVCTANEGRSTVAELVMRANLRHRGLEDRFGVLSSGTMVDAFKVGGFTIEQMKKFVDQAEKRGVYGSDEIKRLHEALRDGDRDAVEGLYDVANAYFQNEEHRARAEAIRDFGISGEVDSGTQFVVRPDVVAVFAMDDRNRDKVIGEYEESSDFKGIASDPGDICYWARRNEGDSVLGDSVLITTLPAYGHNDPDKQIDNGYSIGRGAYRDGVRGIMEAVPLALDRALPGLVETA
jgi:hypothetical protein